MAVPSREPNYKKDMIKILSELKAELLWCMNHKSIVSKAKIEDFQVGMRNLIYLAEKIDSDWLLRHIERLSKLIDNWNKDINKIPKDKWNLAFERINEILKHLK